jgi:hypothetical protein
MFEAANDATSFFSAIPFGVQDSELPITIVPAADPHNPLSSLINFGEGLHNTDQFRVKIIGSGTIELVDDAQATLPFNAFVGIETINSPTCEIATTDITVSLADNSSFAIGLFNYNEGGVLQIGNVEEFEGHSVNFTLTLDGDDANFSIGSRGFVGLGVGIERFDGMLPLVRARICPTFFVPNENIVNTLYNVDTTTFNFLNGRFQHDRIFSGDDVNAALLAVSGAEGVTFDLNFELQGANIDPELARESNFTLAGGGNIVLVQPGEGGLQPVVLSEAGEVSERLTVGMMASTLLQPSNEDVTGLTGAQFFDYIATQDAVADTDRDNTFGRANAATQGDSVKSEAQNIRIGAISDDIILRVEGFDLIGVGQENAKSEAAIRDAAVFVNIDPALNEIITATNIGL